MSVLDKAVIPGKWKIQTNAGGKGRSTRGKNDPKVSAWQRVQQHKNEHLTVTEGNRLRCNACKETISKKKSTVKKHITSGKHVQAKKAIEISKKKDQSLLQFLTKQSFF